MEGVGAEAASLAGHLELDNLCWIYDNNHITIEGSTRIAFTEDVAARFMGYGWNVLRVGDANDLDRIEHALAVFRATTEPADAHHPRQPHRLRLAAQAGHGGRARRAARRGGSAADQARVRLAGGCAVPGARRRARAFRRRRRRARCGRARKPGTSSSPRIARKYPGTRARRSTQMQRRELPEGWDRDLPVFPADPKGIAGRDASGQVLNVLAQNIPWLLGGSGRSRPVEQDDAQVRRRRRLRAGAPGGRNLHFGIREHAMGAILNGMSLSKLRPFGATFFIFSDYARPAIRLSALMELPRSSGSSRTTRWATARTARRTSRSSSSPRCARCPGMTLLRPGDANEVVEAYRCVMQLQAPAGDPRAVAPAAAHARSHAIRVRGRRCARRLRPGRRARRRTGTAS